MNFVKGLSYIRSYGRGLLPPDQLIGLDEGLFFKDVFYLGTATESSCWKFSGAGGGNGGILSRDIAGKHIKLSFEYGHFNSLKDVDPSFKYGVRVYDKHGSGVGGIFLKTKRAEGLKKV